MISIGLESLILLLKFVSADLGLKLFVRKIEKSRILFPGKGVILNCFYQEKGRFPTVLPGKGDSRLFLPGKG